MQSDWSIVSKKISFNSDEWWVWQYFASKSSACRPFFASFTARELAKDVEACEIVPPVANVMLGFIIAEYWVQLVKSGITIKIKTNLFI